MRVIVLMCLDVSVSVSMGVCVRSREQLPYCNLLSASKHNSNMTEKYKSSILIQGGKRNKNANKRARARARVRKRERERERRYYKSETAKAGH